MESPRKVFVSYNHSESDWVRDSLVPCLEAGGSTLLVDYREFAAGKRVVGQMDALQDRADIHLLVLTPSYLNSAYCIHEMRRAIACDPTFQQGVVLPVIRKDCEIPDCFTGPEAPLRVDWRDGNDFAGWDLMMKACRADLGVSVPDWLHARDQICRCLESNTSVNLVVQGERVKWRELIEHVRTSRFSDMGTIDMESPLTANQRGFVREILRASRMAVDVPPQAGEDLVCLGRRFEARTSKARIAIKHFDLAGRRFPKGRDLFASLRHLVTESKKLVLLIHSRRHFCEILPEGPGSSIGSAMETVELRGRA